MARLGDMDPIQVLSEWAALPPAHYLADADGAEVTVWPEGFVMLTHPDHLPAVLPHDAEPPRWYTMANSAAVDMDVVH